MQSGTFFIVLPFNFPHNPSFDNYYIYNISIF